MWHVIGSWELGRSALLNIICYSFVARTTSFVRLNLIHFKRVNHRTGSTRLLFDFPLVSSRNRCQAAIMYAINQIEALHCPPFVFIMPNWIGSNLIPFFSHWAFYRMPEDEKKSKRRRERKQTTKLKLWKKLQESFLECNMANAMLHTLNQTKRSCKMYFVFSRKLNSRLNDPLRLLGIAFSFTSAIMCFWSNKN